MLSPRHRKLDIMFNNAGIIPPILYTSVFDSKKRDFEKVFDVNVYNAFLGAKHAALIWSRQRHHIHGKCGCRLRLQGKVALITGGASGIGEATAKLFTRYGAKVIIADFQDDRGQAVCKELGSTTISYVHCDVTKESDVKNAVDFAVSKHGKLDIMFNNAGITPPLLYTSIFDSEKSHFEKVFDVNVYGAFLGAKHAARVMVPAKSGSIIFTASVAAVIGLEAPPAYTCSKHAVVGLSNHMCMELGKDGIRVNCISPFLVQTPMIDGALGSAVDKNKAAEWLATAANLKGVTLKAHHIAEAAAFLGSDESKYVSGLNLVVDGGYSKVNPLITNVIKGSYT
ncbi:hypothetical protein BUALT_Bualt09G0092100 [Buddleja alternifolia]|uniref:Uncharacterized protein n=1 Tax=Buddleja alternifolia TaxID=168488 RepID=A0AAV6X168_9LAMI|nr:hypothetical protein BUALT_Bualt09G0092100 [Buddleja alternifolia]